MALFKIIRLRNIFLFAIVMVIFGCGSPVELLDTTLEYRSGGRMGFGSPSPFFINVKLKLPSGDYEKVKIIFFGDEREIGAKTITFMSGGRVDAIDVEYGDIDFIYAKNKKIEVTLISEARLLKGLIYCGFLT